MMKKLIFFITTLLFFIPNVSAFNSDGLYLDFRSSSSASPQAKYLELLSDTCTEDGCYTYANTLGHQPTYFEYYEYIISELDKMDYYYFITIDSYDPATDTYDRPHLEFFLLDSSSVDDISFKSYYEKGSYFEFVHYRLYSESNGFNFDYYTSDSMNCNFFDCSSTTDSYNQLINNIETNYMWRDKNLQAYLFRRDVDTPNVAFDYDSYDFLYYSNIPFTYDIGSNYTLFLFSDFFTVGDGSLAISTGLGPATNKYLFLRTYYSADTFYPTDPDNPGDKPGEDESDATNQDIVDGLGDLNSSIGDLNDSINSSDVNSSDYENFFSDFEDNNHGLLSFITAPLSFIQSLTNSTCTPITVPIPFVDSSVTLPCMTTIYQRYFGSFFTVYQMITNGIIAYWIGINCYRIVKNMKNPNSYYVEVMGL